MVELQVDFNSMGDIEIKSQDAVYPVDMQFIHPRDRDLIYFLADHRHATWWVAGGACLAWYQNQPTSTDIDLYFRSSESWNYLNSFISCYQGSQYTITNVASTANACTYQFIDRKSDTKFTVQLIKKKFYPTLEAVLDDFDITVCKIGTDGQSIVIRSTFVEDVATRTLRFDSINPMSHKRLVKYMAYGYEPAAGVIEDLVNDDNIDWDSKGTDHYA